MSQKTPESLKSPPSLNCLMFDRVYQDAMRIEGAFKKDVNGIIANKLDCFRTSIFQPYTGVLNGFTSFFGDAESNAGTVSILTTKMNKFVDLVKLIQWLSSVFEPNSASGATSILNEPAQINALIDDLPVLSADLESFGKSLEGLNTIHNDLNVNDLNNLKTGKDMFQLLNKLKSYEIVIHEANIAVKAFWEKYFDLISATSYSKVLFDIYKGIDALNELIMFVIRNINGVKIKDIFTDYSKLPNISTTLIQ